MQTASAARAPVSRRQAERAKIVDALAKYAPGVPPGRSPLNTLFAEAGKRGHEVGLDLDAGDWVVSDRGRPLLRIS